MPRVKQNSNIISKLKMLIFTTLAAVVAAAILLVLSAVLLDKLGLNAGQARILIYAVYIISALAAGLMAGKWQRERKFMWGALAGTVWLVTVLVVSLCTNGTAIDAGELFPAFVCRVGGGRLGGMLA